MQVGRLDAAARLAQQTVERHFADEMAQLNVAKDIADRAKAELIAA